MFVRSVFVALAALALPAVASAQDAKIASGKIAFLACSVCHSVKPGEMKMGPSLAGVVGRKAGSLPGYTYSPALAKVGYVWDEAHLSAFLAGPAKAVSGTKMAYRGVDDEAKRASLVAYLKSLSAK